MVTAKLYILGGLVIAFLALAGTALWYRGNAIKAEADLAGKQIELQTAQAVNASQQATLDRVLAFKAADEAAALSLKAKLEGIVVTADKAATSVRDLERTSADVKAYLNTAVPDDLKRLLSPQPDRKP